MNPHKISLSGPYAQSLVLLAPSGHLALTNTACYDSNTFSVGTTSYGSPASTSDLVESTIFTLEIPAQSSLTLGSFPSPHDMGYISQSSGLSISSFFTVETPQKGNVPLHGLVI